MNVAARADPKGQENKSVPICQTTQYLYDGLDIVADLQAGATTATYLRSLNIDEPFSRTKGGATAYYLQDALGSVIGLSDATGALTTTYAYDAFGAVTQSGAASDQPFKYTGREDDGTGLYYYRARYYSPEMRRFVSQDPIRERGGDLNLYAYVRNNPPNIVDPSGRSIWHWLIHVLPELYELIDVKPVGETKEEWEAMLREALVYAEEQRIKQLLEDMERLRKILEEMQEEMERNKEYLEEVLGKRKS